ncbi:hypothetical protein [Iningainema tapete]|uniref:Uncharacterized protein n=1 Tax=Iningainema tapete BLCC-T55 TaxID=2748662 RepID=A0A8J6XIV8_9CYAN|nr:hypothetical protein [Iningainema tapete]MBD2775283.1 hypothetical protein [Iningainema tapete BLCC-T55]
MRSSAAGRVRSGGFWAASGESIGYGVQANKNPLRITPWLRYSVSIAFEVTVSADEEREVDGVLRGGSERGGYLP